MVPPFCTISDTLIVSISTISSSNKPAYPRRIPFTFSPLDNPARTTARIAAFIPGASPPLVNTPIVFTAFSDITVYLQSSFIVRYLQNFFNTHLYYFDIFFCKFFIKFLQQFRTYFCHTTVWKLLFCTFCGQIDNDLILTIVFCQRIKQ